MLTFLRVVHLIELQHAFPRFYGCPSFVAALHVCIFMCCMPGAGEECLLSMCFQLAFNLSSKNVTIHPSIHQLTIEFGFGMYCT
jgi:hypothetical protein